WRRGAGTRAGARTTARTRAESRAGARRRRHKRPSHRRLFNRRRLRLPGSQRRRKRKSTLGGLEAHTRRPYIPELETMPASRSEVVPATASSAARAATCRQIWAAVKPTAAGEHSTQEQKKVVHHAANRLVDEFKGRIPVDRVGETRAVKLGAVKGAGGAIRIDH
ncbi:unnamed protein product, partial [Ectocarpus sp. 4 AP-2014]